MLPVVKRYIYKYILLFMCFCKGLVTYSGGTTQCSFFVLETGFDFLFFFFLSLKCICEYLVLSNKIE